MTHVASLVGALAVLCGAAGHSNSVKGAQLMDFCTVVKSPEKYDGHVISTRGVLLPGEHSLSFYDPACRPSEANIVSAQGVLEDSATPAKLVRKLRRFFGRRSAARVSVEGVFYSTGGPFGADLARFRISIRRLESVDKVQE